MDENPANDNESPSSKFLWYRIWPKKVPGSDVHKALGTPGKILFYSIQQMDDRNMITIQQRDIGQQFGISRAQVSRILREFEKVNILVIGRGRYMINPDFIFRGFDEQRNRARKRYIAKRNSKNIKGKIPTDAEIPKG